MPRQFSQFFVNFLLLSTLLQISEICCLRRLTQRKLSAEADDIRSILSSTLDAKPSQMIENTNNSNNKRDISSEDLASADSQAEENVASDSKEVNLYGDDVDDEYLDDDPENSEHKRNVEADPEEKSENQVNANSDDGTELHEAEDVAKRDTKNEDDYNEDEKAENSVFSGSQVDEVKARSINPKSTENLKQKSDNRRSANLEEVNLELEFEKQIEDQIQQRIDSIKEDIKREIEKKQQIREIEANNAKYDELELNRDDDELENEQTVDSGTLDSSKRSILKDKEISNEVEKSGHPVRSKRSGIEVDNERSQKSGLTNGIDKSSQDSELRSKRFDLDEVDEKKKNGDSSLVSVVPVKKRNIDRRMIIVEKNNSHDEKRKERSSILIPERGHAEVKDELPSDLTLGSNLRIARSDPNNSVESKDSSRSSRSVVQHEDQPKRYRRHMADEVEKEEEETMQDSFLFTDHEKSGCQKRRRRNRDRKKAQKHLHRSKRHRAIRESPMDDDEIDEERDKRDMSLDEDIALEYKDSFGGLQADSGGSLGRFKRIRRSSKIS